MRRVAVFTVLLCALSSCDTQVSAPARIVRGDAPGVLGFVPVADGWLLLRCNTNSDLHAYAHQYRPGHTEYEQADDGGHGHTAVIENSETCYAVLEQIFTTEELTIVEQRIAADLHHDTHNRMSQIGLSAALALLSLPISQAIVASFKVSIPITLGVGFAFYHIHRQVQQIVSLQREMKTALAELRNPSARHNSSMSLTCVEEILLRYLTSLPSD